MRKLAKISGLFILAGLLSNCDTKDPAVIATKHNDAKFSDPGKDRDSEFLVKNASFYLQEIELAKLAQQNSIDKSVQVTGKTLEREYRQLYGLLKDLCAKKTISIPSEVTEKDKTTDVKLSYEIAGDFDQSYLDEVIRDHRDAISMHLTEKNSSADPEINELTGQSLSIIRKNFDFVLLRHRDKIGKAD